MQIVWEKCKSDGSNKPQMCINDHKHFGLSWWEYDSVNVGPWFLAIILSQLGWFMLWFLYHNVLRAPLLYWVDYGMQGLKWQGWTFSRRRLAISFQNFEINTRHPSGRNLCLSANVEVHKLPIFRDLNVSCKTYCTSQTLVVFQFPWDLISSSSLTHLHGDAALLCSSAYP